MQLWSVCIGISVFIYICIYTCWVIYSCCIVCTCVVCCIKLYIYTYYYKYNTIQRFNCAPVTLCDGSWLDNDRAAEWTMLIHYCKMMTPPYLDIWLIQHNVCAVPTSDVWCHSLCEVNTSRKSATQNITESIAMATNSQTQVSWIQHLIYLHFFTLNKLYI